MKELDTQRQGEVVGFNQEFLLFDPRYRHYQSYEITAYYERSVNLAVPSLPFNVPITFDAGAGLGTSFSVEPFYPGRGYIVTDEDLNIDTRREKLRKITDERDGSGTVLFYKVFPDDEHRALATEHLNSKPDDMDILNGIYLQVTFSVSNTIYETTLKPNFAEALLGHSQPDYRGEFFFTYSSCSFYPTEMGPLASDQDIPPGHAIGIGEWPIIERNLPAISGKFLMKE